LKYNEYSVNLLDYSDLEMKLNKIKNFDTKLYISQKIKSFAKPAENATKQLHEILRKYSNVPNVNITTSQIYTNDLPNNDKTNNNLCSYLKEYNTNFEGQENNNNPYYKTKFQAYANDTNTNNGLLANLELNFDPFERSEFNYFESQVNDIPEDREYHKLGNDIKMDRTFSQKFFVSNYKQLKYPNKLVKIESDRNSTFINNFYNKTGKRKTDNKDFVYFEEINQNYKGNISIPTGELYINTDLIERIYLCPDNNTITLNANESNKIGILLLDYLRIEKESKIKSIEYENMLNEFIKKYDEDTKLLSIEREELLNE
jgi:hypothetical protein